MKIIIGITYYYPNISGVTIYAKRLAEGLVKHGHQVVVLTSWHDKSLPQKEEINGVWVIRSLVLFKIGKGVIMPFLPFQLIALAKNCQVINCHLPQFESFIFAVLGKILGKKVILTHHTDLSGWKGLFNRLSEISVWSGQLVAAAFADKIVPYTKDYAEHSWYLKMFRSKVECILPPIITGKPDILLEKKWRKEIGDCQYFIGFAGRIAKQKGIPYLLRAIPFLEKKLNTSFKIIFAGPYKGVIGESYYEEISALLKKYQDRLHFLGDISEEKMASFYSLCDVLVLPSDDRLESFGLVQIEAMLNNCPVVATDLPGARMPVKMTQMGLIVPVGDAEAIAEAVFTILRNRSKFVILKRKIEEIFNYQKTISAYEKLFLD
ncbi:MAG: glycosyltransferase family 4 protein [Patescibacteria group bacterium]|nr:glycosyltransferase family 4 protein [Patescibacteria group bacterium]